MKSGSVDPTLPANPDDLLKRPGWKETTHPEAGKKGHRTFENEKTGEKLRHDKGKPWETAIKLMIIIIDLTQMRQGDMMNI